MKTYIKSWFESVFSGLAKRSDIDNFYRQLSALLDIKEIIGPKISLFPLHCWSLSPDALLVILRDIVERKAPRVIEFGSG